MLAALVKRGYAMLADNVAGVVLDAGGRPVVLPAFPGLRLWADALDKLAWPGRMPGRMRPALEKYLVPVDDRLADPTAAFGAIVRFAGLDRAGTPPDGPVRLARAVRHAGFSRLRAEEEESGFVEKQPTAPSFFRAGVAGSWRQALAPRQVRALVDTHGPVMARLGYLSEAQAFLNAPTSR